MFSSNSESRSANEMIMDQIKTIKSRVPNRIDKDVENFIGEIDEEITIDDISGLQDVLDSKIEYPIDADDIEIYPFIHINSGSFNGTMRWTGQLYFDSPVYSPDGSTVSFSGETSIYKEDINWQFYVDEDLMYTSIEDTDTPDLVDTWEIVNGGYPSPAVEKYSGPTIQDSFEQIVNLKSPEDSVFGGSFTFIGLESDVEINYPGQLMTNESLIEDISQLKFSIYTNFGISLYNSCVTNC